MAKIKVADITEVQPGKMIGLDVQGKRVLIANLDGRIYCMDGICSHQGGHLWEGKLIGATVKCPRHGSEFDLATGRNLKGPWIPFGKAHDLKVYPASLEGKDIFVEM